MITVINVDLNGKEFDPAKVVINLDERPELERAFINAGKAALAKRKEQTA